MLLEYKYNYVDNPEYQIVLDVDIRHGSVSNIYVDIKVLCSSQ